MKYTILSNSLTCYHVTFLENKFLNCDLDKLELLYNSKDTAVYNMEKYLDECIAHVNAKNGVYVGKNPSLLIYVVLDKH